MVVWMTIHCRMSWFLKLFTKELLPLIACSLALSLVRSILPEFTAALLAGLRGAYSMARCGRLLCLVLCTWVVILFMLSPALLKGCRILWFVTQVLQSGLRIFCSGSRCCCLCEWILRCREVDVEVLLKLVVDRLLFSPTVLRMWEFWTFKCHNWLTWVVVMWFSSKWMFHYVLQSVLSICCVDGVFRSATIAYSYVSFLQVACSSKFVPI